jgi:hypothetical protein
MRKIVLSPVLTLLISFAGSPSLANEILPNTPEAALAAKLITMEKEEWQLYKNKDAARLAAMISDDFSDLYSTGKVMDRTGWLADMKRVSVERFELSNFHTFLIAENVVLITYEGKAWAKTMDGKSVFNDAAVTSAWARRGDQWLNVFYGETALDAESRESVNRAYSTGKE